MEKAGEMALLTRYLRYCHKDMRGELHHLCNENNIHRNQTWGQLSVTPVLARGGLKQVRRELFNQSAEAKE